MQNLQSDMMEALFQKLEEIKSDKSQYIPAMQEIIPESLYYPFTIDEEVLWLENNFTIAYYRPINSERLFGKILIFLRKVIRKILMFLIYPITYDQNSFNAHTAATLRKVEYELSDQKEIIEELTELVGQLSEENKCLKEKLASKQCEG